MASLKEKFGSTSYREAQAWVFVIVNILVLAIYASEVFGSSDELGGESLPALAGLIIVSVCTTIFTVLLIVPMAIIFNQTANEKADERDKRIRSEAGALAFWTLFVVAVLSLVAYIFHASGDFLFHTILMTILAAQLVYAFGTAVKYRRSGVSFFAKAQD